MEDKKYAPTFNNKLRSFRIIKIKSKEGNYMKSTGVMSTFLNKVIYFPIARTSNEVADGICSLFGSEGYNRYVKQYFFPKRIIFKPSLVPGPKRIINTDIKEKRSIAQQNLPRIQQEPGIKMPTNRNVVIDYSKIFDILMFRDKKMMVRERVRNYLHKIIPEALTYLVTGDDTMNYIHMDHCIGLNILANSPTTQFLTHKFDRVVFTYKLKSTMPMAFAMTYLMGKTALPKTMLLDPDTTYDFSLIRFIVRTYTNDYDEEIDTGYNDWMNFMSKANASFYIYNDNYAFLIDLKQIKDLGWSDNRFIQSIRTCVNLLVKNNINEITCDQIDSEIVARDQTELDDVKLVDENEDKTDISTKTKVEAPQFPDYTKQQDKEITKLIENMLKKDEVKPEKMKVKNSRKIIEYQVSKAYRKEFDEFLENEKIDYSILDEKMDEIEAKELANSVVGDDEFENDTDDIMESDEEVAVPDETGEYTEEEVEMGEEEGLDAEVEELNESDMEEPEDISDKSEEVLEIENKSDDQAQEELSEEEKKAVLKSIEKETQPKKTPKEIARIKVVREKYKSIKVDDNRTVAEILEDTKAITIDRNIKEVPHLRDKSLQHMNVLDLEKSYVEKTMMKDTVSILKSFSEDKTINLHMIDFEKKDTSDTFNDKETYTIKFEDETQKRHTLKFDMPKVDENGRIKINGNTKILKKQLILKPIVKLGPDSVWITSQFNKVLLTRKGNTVNRSTHILKSLLVDKLQDSTHTKIQYGNASNHNKDYLTTVEYDDISSRFVSIDLFPTSANNRVEFLFSQPELRQKIDKYTNSTYKYSETILPLGIDYKNGKVIDVDIKDKNSSVSTIILNKILESNVVPELSIEVAKIKVPKKRVYTDITLQSKSIPLIVFLSALFGLSKVLDAYKCKIELSESVIPKDRRPYIRFKDMYLYYEDYPLENSLLINGLTKVNTEDHEFGEYDEIAPYLEFLYKEFKSTNIYKGWTSFKELFVDPITKEILQTLSLPTDFLEIFLYANDLLGDNHFYHETDLRNYRVRGYEMLNEYLYKALSTQYIVLKQMKNPAKLNFSVPNDIVINKLYKSPLLAGCDITNPLNELKEKSIISYKGTSGVNLQEAFKMEKRAYSPNAMGVIGFATVDNASVGVTKELTMNCDIVNTRGFINTIDKPEDAKDLKYSSMCTVEESFFPYMMRHDDPNRIGFACNQTIHTEECDGAGISLVGTGTEKVIAYKCPSTFAGKAKEDGKIIEVDEEAKKILIEYKSGKREVYDYGLKLNRNSNYFLENDLKCVVKTGQNVKKGDILTYNSNFFEWEGKDIFLKMGVVANVAIFDGSYTDDDSTLVSSTLSERMNTSVVMRKQIALSKSTNLIKYAKVGDEVLMGDPLMIFEDTFDDSSSKILEQLGDLSEEEKAEMLYKSPKSNGTGVIVNMDVYWTVPLEEMRPSLQNFVMEYQRKLNKEIRIEKKFTGEHSKLEFKTGISVPHKDRIEGVIVPEEGGVIVSYYISHKKGVSVGDKISVNSSLKSVVARVTPPHLNPYRENGPVDLITSYIGISKRQINSIYFAGGIGKILFDYGKKLAKKYLGLK